MDSMNQLVQELVLKYHEPDLEEFVTSFDLLGRVAGEDVSLQFLAQKHRGNCVRVLCSIHH